MNIEELSKTQIILLTLLVSFVTSIATGIVTVSLLEQAPPGLTQTINRVVERTVERVVTEPGEDTVITKETTVVVKEEDTITKAIDSASGSILPIFSEVVSEEGVTSSAFVGWGVVVSSEGFLVTDSSFISGTGSYLVEVSDGSRLSAKVISQEEDKKIAVLRLEPAKDEKLPTLSPAKLADSQGLRLGQTVISFGGKGKRSVSTGIISSFSQTEIKDTSSTTPKTSPKIVVTGIETTAVTPGAVTGSPLVNVFGDVVGIAVSTDTGKGSFFRAVNLVKEEISKLEAPPNS